MAGNSRTSSPISAVLSRLSHRESAGGTGRSARRYDLRQRRKRAASWQRRHKGQSIIIFALTLTVLLGFAGLAVDVTRVYDLYARMQRAAEAGVLAGVIYLPNYYNTAMPAPGDGNSAVSRALQETVKNGFGQPVAPTFAACPTPITAIEVAVCQVSGQQNLLSVSITETTPLALLGALGMRPVTLTATARAQFMPPFPVGLAATPNYFGDEGDCNVTGGSQVNCNPSGSGAHAQNFMANIEGPADLKEAGDPYVYCEEGPSNPYAEDQGIGVNNGLYTLQDYMGTATSFNTNHVQYSPLTQDTTHCGQPIAGGNPGNPDQQPAGFDGPATRGTAHPGAYNYQIVVPPANSGAGVWIYNAPYVPFISSGNSCPGRQPVDTFRKSHDCSSWATTYGTYTFNGKFDDPYFFFNVTYTLYQVNAPYFRGVDVPIWQMPAPVQQRAPFGDATGAAVPVRPYDMMNQDLSAHGCQTNGSTAYDLGGLSSYGTGSGAGACVASPACFQNWCKLAEGLPAGTYRLAVEVTGYNPSGNTATAWGPFAHGWGKHNYGLKVCANGSSNGTGCPSGGSISAWNNMDITVQFPAANGQNVFPLADIPVDYAGRLINVGFYDPGDSDPGNDAWFAVVPPTTNEAGTLTNPTIPITYGQDCQGNPVVSWITNRIEPMPAVSGGPANGQPSVRVANSGDNIFNGLWIMGCIQLPPNYVGGLWQMDIYSAHGGNTDSVAISFTLVGSPVHLLPPGP